MNAREDALNFLTDGGFVWPLPDTDDGRHARISDPWHPVGDMEHRNGRGHRGQDIMFERAVHGEPESHNGVIWKSKMFEVYPTTPIIAALGGKVVRRGMIGTGYRVWIDHGRHVTTGYYHLSRLDAPEVGKHVAAGDVLGVVGWNIKPKAHTLAHLHFDVIVGIVGNQQFIDAEKYMKHWKHISLAKTHAGYGTEFASFVHELDEK